MWFIWQQRNNKVWQDITVSANQIGMQAGSYWNQWAAVNGLLQDQQQPTHRRAAENYTVQWQQPPTGFLKCNVDASFFHSDGATGWGWCVRDSRGFFQLAGTNVVHSTLNVLEGEALAILEAMEEMIHRGITFVIFESDSKLVVDAILSTHVGISEFSVLISHIQDLLRMHNYFEVKYVKRQANMVAHSLARAAFSMSRRRIFDSVPRCIESYLINETS
jgi:ribonuclease HI